MDNLAIAEFDDRRKDLERFFILAYLIKKPRDIGRLGRELFIIILSLIENETTINQPERRGDDVTLLFYQ